MLPPGMPRLSGSATFIHCTLRKQCSLPAGQRASLLPRAGPGHGAAQGRLHPAEPVGGGAAVDAARAEVISHVLERMNDEIPHMLERIIKRRGDGSV